MRADALHRLLLSARGQAATIAELRQLPDLRGWAPLTIDMAVADLVADGRLEEGPTGRLVVTRRAA
jgi:hypothetical protein